MWKALVVLSLLIVSTSQAEAKLSVTKRYDHRFNGAGWSVFVHRTANQPDQLVAVNKQNLAVEVLRASNGETVTQDSLDTNARNVKLIETFSTSTGEFLIAFATQSGRVELHTLNGEESFEIEGGLEVTSMSMIERRRGEVFLAVVTRGAAEVYRRQGRNFELIQRISSQSGIQQGKLMRTLPAGDVLLQVFNGARKMHLMKIDAEAKDSQEVLSFSRPAIRMDGVLVEDSDFITSMTDGRNLRFYIDSTKADTATVKVDANLGEMRWLKNADGRMLFTAVSQVANGTRLSLYDPYSITTPIQLGVADANTISDVGSVLIDGKPLYFYVKDNRNLVLQNQNVLLIVPNKTEDRIASAQAIRMGGGKRWLAVVLENERGSRLMMIGLK